MSSSSRKKARSAGKVSAKKTSSAAKKTAPKKTINKVIAKKTAVKKTAVKKTAVKKTAVKKIVNKVIAKKTAAKKTVNKVIAKKTATGKRATEKNQAKKTAKTVIKKTIGKIVGKIVKKADVGGKTAAAGGIRQKDSESVKPVKRLPFGGKHRKKKQVISEKTAAELARLEEEKKFDTFETEEYTRPSNPANGFFYTDDKFVAAFEDRDITEDIRKFHPTCCDRQADDMKTRRAIITMLLDDRFMTALLAKYSMQITDFFRYMYRFDSSIFTGPFVVRIQNALKGKEYAVIRREKHG